MVPYASFITEFLGIGINNPIPSEGGAAGRADFIIGLIQNALTLLFVVIILAAIVYAALAGLKYIQSQGDSTKVEEAAGALKAVLFGVAAVFIGIIGVILVTSIFAESSSIDVRRPLKCFLGDKDSCSTASVGMVEPQLIEVV